ncbi:hypothetical protein AXF42_Ash011996 [Apostasia shenzhenica]|uniref:Uncharacterized protein n=1 Tax=Apostasia shenzhenica TaxID=1088818 RepID=A0A2I0AJG3_9ASPA|nr:hypothetical protein AXF42_Ash011996 [Apostasia shenzhenica]
MVRMKKIAHGSPPSLSASVESSPSERAPASKLIAPSKRTRVKLRVAADSAPRSIRSKKKVKIPISTSTTSSSQSSPSSASSASFSSPSSSGTLSPALNTSAAPTRRQTLRSRSVLSQKPETKFSVPAASKPEPSAASIRKRKLLLKRLTHLKNFFCRFAVQGAGVNDYRVSTLTIPRQSDFSTANLKVNAEENSMESIVNGFLIKFTLHDLASFFGFPTYGKLVSVNDLNVKPSSFLDIEDTVEFDICYNPPNTKFLARHVKKLSACGDQAKTLVKEVAESNNQKLLEIQAQIDILASFYADSTTEWINQHELFRSIIRKTDKLAGYQKSLSSGKK